MKSKLIFVMASIFVLALLFGCSQWSYAEENAATDKVKTKKAARDIIGVTHVNGMYSLTQKDYLNEGADEISKLGATVIKAWLYDGHPEDIGHPAVGYSYHSNWPKVHSLVDIAKAPHFQEFFKKPFKTHILVATRFGRMRDYWVDNFTAEDAAEETNQFYELTKYLLTTYKNTDKTFILQHWEGDWMLRKGIVDLAKDPSEQAFKNMAAWLNARQAGVNKAREEIGQNGVKIYHAAEVVFVVKGMTEKRPCMVTHVLPYVNVDLVSYSAWDAVTTWHQSNPRMLREALDFIAKYANDSPEFGDKNIYIGEYGLPENCTKPQDVLDTVKYVVETGMDWGVQYIVYWQIYCNEPKKGITMPSPNNNDYAGFWLIRADGSKTPVYDYFKMLLQK
jgi:hypothetical protein